MMKLLWIPGMLCSVATVALAGVNAGGGLIVHSPSLAYTTDVTNYCGGSAPPSCDQAVVRIDGPEWWVWTVYAAFPAGSAPRLTGVNIGVSYDKADPGSPTAPDYDGLLVFDHGMCGDFEIADPNWPDPGTGTGMTWPETQTSLLVECYWFAGYNYSHAHYGVSSPEVFELVPHPTQGGNFADDSVPSVLDDIGGYGRLGFDTPGYLPCPETYRVCCTTIGACGITAQEFCGPPSVWHGEWATCSPNPCPQPQPAACCDLTTGACTLTAPLLCQWPSVWHGEWSSCSPNPCPQPASGACCSHYTGECTLTLQYLCTPPRTWHGEWTACSPNPCPQPPEGACCFPPTGFCWMTTEALCQYSYVWHGEWTSCSPNPCPQPPVGVCCSPITGACWLAPQATCAGVWHGEWTSCSPNPCPQPPLGACCAPSSECFVTISSQCPQPSVWHSEWTSCDPNPCPVLPVGACCSGYGICTILTEGACAGVWHAEWPTCEPNPCPQVPGACCWATGECTVTTSVNCPPPGVWHGEFPTCDPYPCPTTPTETTTWGRIKDRYR